LLEHLQHPYADAAGQRAQLDFAQALNQRHRASRGDPALEARIQSFETAFRMQTAATDAFDFAREPAHIRELYGDTPQARQLLLARRLVERGVRFVQVWHGTLQPWDSHDNIEKSAPSAGPRMHAGHHRAPDRSETAWPVRGHAGDLGGEFGRTPTVELSQGEKVAPTAGRDHNHHGFTMWLAGGGTRGGYVHGATDDFGFKAIRDRVHIHDLQATVLHLWARPRAPDLPACRT
jgi:hypothetical protein